MMKARSHRGLYLAVALTALLFACSGGAEVTTFDITLSGDGPPPGAADGRGSGTLSIDSDTGEITWDLEYAGIAEPTAMHIHEGAAGASGGVVVPLDVEGAGSGRLSGSTTADEETVQAILNSPADYYINIHNADHPPGALRGQLGD